MNMPNIAYVPGNTDVPVGMAENKADEDVGAPRTTNDVLANRITINGLFNGLSVSKHCNFHDDRALFRRHAKA